MTDNMFRRPIERVSAEVLRLITDEDGMSTAEYAIDGFTSLAQMTPQGAATPKGVLITTEETRHDRSELIRAHHAYVRSVRACRPPAKRHRVPRHRPQSADWSPVPPAVRDPRSAGSRSHFLTRLRDQPRSLTSQITQGSGQPRKPDILIEDGRVARRRTPTRCGFRHRLAPGCRETKGHPRDRRGG